jgi:hypothetical protein
MVASSSRWPDSGESFKVIDSRLKFESSHDKVIDGVRIKSVGCKDFGGDHDAVSSLGSDDPTT